MPFGPGKPVGPGSPEFPGGPIGPLIPLGHTLSTQSVLTVVWLPVTRRIERY